MSIVVPGDYCLGQLLAVAQMEAAVVQQQRSRIAQLCCIWGCSNHPAAVQGRSKELSGRQRLRAGPALAAVLALAVAAAVRPALWALSFAFARWRRIALLGYWVALLAAALPLMDWVSRRRKVPTIIVRKVWSIAYEHFTATSSSALACKSALGA